MFGRRKNTVQKEDEVKEVEKTYVDDEATNSYSNEDEKSNNENENQKESTSEKDNENKGNKQESKDTDDELVLYMLVDKMYEKKYKYIKESGLKVEKIYDSVESARKSLLIQSDTYMMAIVDTGTGELTGLAYRDSLIDLIGIVDEESAIVVFYTDEALKADAKEGLNSKVFRRIKWIKYKNTADTIRQLRDMGKYKYDDFHIERKEQDIEENINNIIGIKQMDRADKYIKRVKKINREEVTVDNIRKLMIEDDKEESNKDEHEDNNEDIENSQKEKDEN